MPLLHPERVPLHSERLEELSDIASYTIGEPLASLQAQAIFEVALQLALTREREEAASQEAVNDMLKKVGLSNLDLLSAGELPDFQTPPSPGGRRDSMCGHCGYLANAAGLKRHLTSSGECPHRTPPAVAVEDNEDEDDPVAHNALVQAVGNAIDELDALIRHCTEPTGPHYASPAAIATIHAHVKLLRSALVPNTIVCPDCADSSGVGCAPCPRCRNSGVVEAPAVQQKEPYCAECRARLMVDETLAVRCGCSYSPNGGIVMPCWRNAGGSDMTNVSLHHFRAGTDQPR